MGKQLGVTFEFENGTFDTLITGLRSKRYDVAMSAMTDTKDRQEGVDAETGKKVGEGVDFVDYFTACVSIYTKKGDDQGIKTWADLCGKKVVLQRGTVSEDLAKAENEKCPAGRRSPSRPSTTTSRPDPAACGRRQRRFLRLPGRRVRREDLRRRQGLRAGRRAGRGRPYGIAVAKSNTELRDALKAALDALIENGEYQKIMDKWGVAEGSIDEATINGGK
ncbi:transporter substrate-binding domain-containing protein [Streptomyces sp. INA 01156]